MSVIAVVHFVNYKKGTQSRGAMGGVMFYVMQEKKTLWAGEQLISGINCQPQTAYDEFLNTKALYHKSDGVMFYHMVQSFPKGEAVDPATAHEAARRLSEYFEGCEVLICTHVDREHIHSHCIINSVNFETGKKLHLAKEQVQELKQRNDAICQELGLPVFQPSVRRHARGMGGAEYHTALKGQSWKLRLANTVDECMRYAGSRTEFISLMESEGYTVRWESSRKSITYTTPDGMKCRDSKLHEDKYLKEVMEYEFRIRAKLAKRRADENAERIKADESAQQRRAESHNTASDAYRDPVPTAGSTDEFDTADERSLLGAGGDQESATRLENAYRPDNGAELTDGITEIIGADQPAAGTGWEEEREAYLQMVGLAPGLLLPHAGQMDRTDIGFDRGDAGSVVRRGDGTQQCAKPALLTAALRTGLCSLKLLEEMADDDGGDAEEKRRRIQAQQEAENIGMVLGALTGTAIVLTHRAQENTEQKNEKQQQTMGGL